jgi:hypothetical protein
MNNETCELTIDELNVVAGGLTKEAMKELILINRPPPPPLFPVIKI